MKQLKFKNNDTIDCIGLGTWKSPPEEVTQAVITALEAGYRHIDAAAIYQNEPALGKAFKTVFNKGDIKREEVFVTSKLWNDSHRAQDVQPALEKTLRDLNLDYLDLYLMHWPVAFKPGVTHAQGADEYASLNEIPLIETWKAMEALKEKGLVKHIGVSNFSIKKLEDLIDKATITPEMNQVELHPLLQQDKLMEYCESKNILVTAYSPLGSGDRSEAMKAENEPKMMELEAVKILANKHNCTSAQILISWHLQRGNTVIPKSTNPKRIQENIEAAKVQLDKDDMNTLKRLDRHFRYVTGEFFNCPEKGYENVYDE